MPNIEHFISRYGLVTNNDEGHPSGNDLRYTGDYFVALKRKGIKFDEASVRYAVNRCFKSLGLLTRGSGIVDQEGLDDYVAIASLSRHLNADWAEQFLYHWNKTGGIFNNTGNGIRHPDGRINWSSMFFRFPALKAHFKYCSGENPSVIEKIGWFIGVYLGIRDGSQDSLVLAWHLIINGFDHPMHGYLSRKLSEAVESKYGGMGCLINQYFGHQHPIADVIEL